MTTIALAIPTTSLWTPARADSLYRLKMQLWPDGAPCQDSYKEFTDRAPNWQWAETLWQWLVDTGADWALQLQDDVMVAPCFWPALRAMLAALPADADVVGLTSTHPMAPDVAKRGHRWYRTAGNLVGWAYCIRRTSLAEFLEGRAQMPEGFRKQNEDEQLAQWAAKTERGVWHPVPAIVDHDTSIPSSYANDAHSHRRPQVTWREFPEASLTDPTWWKPSGTPEMLHMPAQFECWGCGNEPGAVKFQTGLRLGKQCVAALLSNMVGKL